MLPHDQRVDVNMNHNQLLNRVIEKLSTPPLNPEEGQEYYDTTLKMVGIFNGVGWFYAASGGGTSVYTEVFGDGISLNYLIAHNLNSTSLIAEVTKITTKRPVGVDIQYTDPDHITISFAKPPSPSELKVVVK